MKSKRSTTPRDRTRRAILEAVADVISDGGGIGFSVQAVADRAGVTHRTIYNHFPTREALCEGYAAYVDEVLLESSGMPKAPEPTLDGLPALTGDLYSALARSDRHARAYAMLMIGSRNPSQTWRSRSRLIEREITEHAAAGAPVSPRVAAAAVRMFASTMGWHLLTDQCGLTTDEAAAASRWATQTLLDAAVGKRQIRKPRSSKRGQDAIRRR